MTMRSPKSRNFSTNSLFAAFSLGLIGWGLLHAWGISVRVGVSFHALAVVPGLVLSGIALYRYRQHWPADPTPWAGKQKHGLQLPWHPRAIASYLLLLAIGFAIALLIKTGSMFLLVPAMIGMIAAPWTKIAVCRGHFFASSALLQAGVLLGFVFLDSSVHPLYYALAAWLFLSAACTVIVSVILVHGNRLDRMPVSGY